MRFALGPQFGTLALGAAVLTAIQLMRQALQRCAPPLTPLETLNLESQRPGTWGLQAEAAVRGHP